VPASDQIAGLPREGFRDLSRRVRIAWIWAERIRVRRQLADAEAQLGWLGWQRADFFAPDLINAVAKVREFEDAQASLMNVTAELSGRKAKLDEELAREKARHDEALAALAKEREPIAAQITEKEGLRRRKLEAIERFDRALGELAAKVKRLEALSTSYMKVEQPRIEIRTKARETSEDLIQLAFERQRVDTSRKAAAEAVAGFDAEIGKLRTELERIDAAQAAARAQFTSARRRLTGEHRKIERTQRKSHAGISSLDRKKRKPYRLLGTSLADQGIAPMNQPEALEQVGELRNRVAGASQTISELRAECAAAKADTLVAFYLLLVFLALLAGLVIRHFLR